MTAFLAGCAFLLVHVAVLTYCIDCEEGGNNCTLAGNNVTNVTERSATLSSIEITTIPTSTREPPHVIPLTESSKNISKLEVAKGRALNFTEDRSHENILASNSSSARDEFGDLSDVNMDHDEEEEEEASKMLFNNKTLGICEKGGLTYENGEKLESGCESICTCENGKMDCVDRCTGSFFKRGKRIEDPLCIAKDVEEDPCCAILVCTADTETEPLEICHYNNKTYNRGDHFKKDCNEICTCEAAGKLSCKARCAPVNKTSDRCVEIPDPNDSCCKTVLCDVTLDDHEPEKETETPQKPKISSAKYVNATEIKIKFDMKIHDKTSLPMVELSDDKKNWKSYKISYDGIVRGFKSGVKYLRLEDSEDIFEVQRPEKTTSDSSGCTYKGQSYTLGQEFNDECTSLCVCKESGVRCFKLECPTYFGVDVIDPNCVEWETVPPDFKPVAPNCCPQELKCKNNGSCIYQDQVYQNWQQLPTNVTGCEKRCYCEMGNIECNNNSCPPVPAIPPPDLHCPPRHAVLTTSQEDDCCKYWVCQQPELPLGPQLNDSKVDKKPSKHKIKPTENPFIVIPTKQPSKVLGPLTVYGNDASENATHKFVKPILDENPFYNKEKDNKKKVEIDSPDVPNRTNQFLGPLSPNLTQNEPKNKITKPPSKVKSKPNVNFVTPPSIPQNNKNILDNFPSEHPQNPTPPHIQIHAKGNPQEILDYINQHAELTNYPPGSVLEIHNVVPHDNLQRPLRPQFSNPNSIVPQNVHPFAVNPNQQQTHPLQNVLPPGVTIEQILQEINKNDQHPYQPNVIYPQQNGQILIAPQNGPVPTRQLPNATNKGGIHGQLFPGVLPNVPDYQQNQDEIVVQNLEAVDAHTIRLAFGVPSIYVGLHGRVEVRYTHTADPNPNNWELQIFAPPNDLIATPQLEFDLRELQSNTEYKIKVIITLRDLHNTPSSQVYKITTLKETPQTTLPPLIPIEPNLAVSDVNATWVNVIWRKFTEYELQFVDGVQLRYKEIDGKIYAATPLIHRAMTTYTLENLKPNTTYELGIYFIPFPGQSTELHASHMIYFTTANEIDNYGFNVTLEISQIKPTSVEIAWVGVPYPEDKYVNIYRAIYQSDSGKGDFSTFKVAKRDSPAKTVIMDLKPGTRYRLWLEVYLTNGKIKTSNVQDFITKPRTAPALGANVHQDKLAYSEYPDHKGDYYGPLVIVAILAAIAILSTLILLLILVRRHGQNKASITPPTRVSQSAYDNPTYKVEIQQETMGM